MTEGSSRIREAAPPNQTTWTAASCVLPGVRLTLEQPETGLASASEKGCWCLQPMTESFCWLLPQQEHYSHPQSHTRNVTCSLRSWRKIESSVIGRKKCFTFEMFPNGCSLFHLQEWLCLFHPHLIITSFTNIFIFHTWKIVHEW